MTSTATTLPPALVVFGGTGFVGTAVLAQALTRNEALQIFVVSRTGVAPAWLASEPVYQTARLRFLRGDLLKPESVRAALAGVSRQFKIIACVSCVGAITPWSQKNMVRTCGDANVNAYTISRQLGIKKFAVITRDRSNMNDWWYPFPQLIPGYYQGKDKIEECIAADTGNSGNAICLRAGFVSGTRKTVPGLPTSLKVSVPLAPMYRLLNRFCPTIDVKELAGAAVRFVLAESPSDTVLVLNDAIPGYFQGSV